MADFFEIDFLDVETESSGDAIVFGKVEVDVHAIGDFLRAGDSFGLLRK